MAGSLQRADSRWLLVEGGVSTRAASSAAVLCGWAGTALIIVCAMSLSGGGGIPGLAGAIARGRYGGRPILRQSGAGQRGRLPAAHESIADHWRPILRLVPLALARARVRGCRSPESGSRWQDRCRRRLLCTGGRHLPAGRTPCSGIPVAAAPHGAVTSWRGWLVACDGRRRLAHLEAYAQRQDLIDSRYRLISDASTDMGDLPRECWSYGKSFEVKTCQFGSPQPSATLVLFGDSHAMQWFNAVHGAAEAENWRLLTFVRPSCAARDLNPQDSSVGIGNCRLWRAEAVSQMPRSHPVRRSFWQASAALRSMIGVSEMSNFWLMAAPTARWTDWPAPAFLSSSSEIRPSRLSTYPCASIATIRI